ncbi:hypothetical protein EIN_186970, partial [Entamoeba invadens IP1]|uniref:hypothetical protein n=1 Tax=Entamoeba invadens IP1 TaxID=370355 RepID=UPI0002C3D731
MKAQPLPKRILSGWDRIVSETLQTYEKSRSDEKTIKTTLLDLATEAVRERYRRWRLSTKEELAQKLKISKLVSNCIQNYWDSVGCKTEDTSSLSKTEQLQYNDVVETFKSCPFPADDKVSEDPMTVLKKVGGLTKNQMAEVVNVIESVSKFISHEEEISLLESVRGGVVVGNVPPLAELFKNFNGEKFPILIVLKDSTSIGNLGNLVQIIGRYSRVIALSENDENNILRITRGGSEVVIVSHAVLKRCLSTISIKKYEIVIYEMEDGTEPTTDAYKLNYNSIIVLTKSFDYCFPRFLVLLFPNELTSTFWQRCNASHLNSLSKLLKAMVINVKHQEVSTVKTLPDVLPVKIIRNTEFPEPPLLEIPQFPEFLLIDKQLFCEKLEGKTTLEE